jgi:hypothetical protein
VLAGDQGGHWENARGTAGLDEVNREVGGTAPWGTLFDNPGRATSCLRASPDMERVIHRLHG